MPQPPAPRPTLDLLRRHPGQVAVIAVVLMAFAGAFAYASGVFTPARLSPDRMLDAMETNGGGAHGGFRRAHAKGICLAGSFVGTEAARGLSTAAVFSGATVPVTGRFAEGTPDPFSRDGTVGVRSMALSLKPAGADEWRMGINDIPTLPVSTPEAFYGLQVASTPDPATGKPKPEAMKAFLADHPETATFFGRVKDKPLASGFGNDSYNSLDGFVFVAPDGTRRLVRWSMQATAPFATLAPEERKARAANYLFDDLLAEVGRGPLHWKLIATLAQAGDPNRAAELWPADRQHVELGTLTVDRIESEAARNCQDVNFDPLVLPSGIVASDDPIPFARSAVYAASFRRRTGEAKPPSAVSSQSAGAGQ